MVSIAVSHDGRRIACGAQDTTVRVFHTESRQEVALQAATLKPTIVRWSPCGRYLAHNGGNDVIAWDWGNGPPGYADISGSLVTNAMILPAHQARVTALDFAPHSTLLASGAADGSVAVWDIGSRGRRLALFLTDAAVSTLNWLFKQCYLCASTATGTVVAWQARGVLEPQAQV
jgi:WD40 repeat protein